MLSGDNGILQKATDAKTNTDNAQIKERIQLAELSARADGKGILSYSKLNDELTKEFGVKGTGYTISDEDDEIWTIKVGNVTYEISNVEKASSSDDTPQEITASTPAGKTVITPNDWTTLNGKAISDGNGTAIPLPTGFYYVGGNYNSGLVISDKENDTMDASGISMGNQFVWIPVTDETNFILTGIEYGVEPYPGGYSTEVTEYNTMKTQVLKYGGFYIGRFEAGINSTTLREDTTTAQTVVCKKGVAPYNYVTWGDSMRNIGTNGAVYLSKNMYSASDSVTSTLCYGCQWDAMCRYIGTDESNRKPTVKTNVELTGSDSTDVSKNIYDLAGNCNEWTMTGYYDEDNDEEFRYLRGGNYSPAYSNYSVKMSNSYYPEDYADGEAFRTTLYVK